MTCKQCLHLAECVMYAEIDPNHAHKLRTIEFWENAEMRCGKFKANTAHWYINPDGYYPQCSNCNEEPDSGERETICPNCGAVMEGETT